MIIENPIKTWWKARKYFKFPSLFVNVGKNGYGLPCYNTHRLIDIFILDVTYKWKYNDIRFEYNPQINILLFNKYQLFISCKIKEPEIYWETLLTFLDRKSIKQAVKKNTWYYQGNPMDAITLDYLTPFGLSQYNKECV